MLTENPAFVWELGAIHRLLDLGVSKAEICRRCGKSRQALYDLLAKENAPTPTTNPGPHTTNQPDGGSPRAYPEGHDQEEVSE